MLDDLRRWALFGSGVAELTKSRAEQIVKELVSAGDVRRKQASGLVKELLEASRDNRKELIRLLRSEVQTQIEAVGLATKRDMERLDRRVKRLEDNLKATRKKTTKTKSSPKKSSSKSTGAGRSPKKEG
jgi:polyhydroxyalkanoate synthesis regulator phasin